MQPSLYLIDGSGYVFRAFYAVPRLSTSRGMPTNAIMGFTRMLVALIEAERPDHIAVAFDVKRETFRNALYPPYKAHRPPPPPDLIPQFPWFAKVVEAMRIPALSLEGFEADDVIGTLARRAVEEWGMRPVIVSGDKDLLQLVDERTTMIDPLKRMTYGPAEVLERFGVPPALVTDVLGLAGDSSDNIPGVPGIGEKTAAKLLAEYGTLDDLLAAADQVKGKRGESLRQFADQARLSRELATIRRDVPIQVDSDALRLTPPDADALRAIYTELEFDSLLAALPPSGEARAVEPAGGADYRCLLTLDEIRQAVAAAMQAELVAFDTETTSTDPMRAELVGISLSWEAGRGVYIPLHHDYPGAPAQPPRSAALDLLRPLLEDPARPKVAQHSKYDWNVLMHCGVDVRGVAGDPMLASYLLDPGRRSHGLDHLARELCGHEMITYAEVTAGLGIDSFSRVPVERAAEYAAEDADYALRLAVLLGGRVAEAGFSSLYEDIELPLSRVLGRMERDGMLVDRELLAALSVEFAGRIATLEGEVHAAAGRPFNIGSPKQLAEILFDELGLPVVKKTKTSRSTDQSVLEQLAARHPLPDRVLAWRHVSKLQSTYIDALPAAIHPETGRVHSSFKQTVAVTGRLSSDSPNLQNIPVRTEEGRRIRAAFVAPPGHVLLTADYSQVELRILAHLSGDPALIEAFVAGDDVHRRTASEVFGVFPELVSPEQRRAAKAINFGIMYGMSPFRLARDLGIGQKQAKAYIDAYFARYGEVRGFVDRTVEEARRHGFVRTLFGRRRFLPELGSRDHAARGRAEREAVNSPVQGTAADLLKLAMVAVGDEIEAGRLAARLVLTVHDELLFEVAREAAEEVGERVRELMAGVAELAVPLTVDVSWGNNWAEAK